MASNVEVNLIARTSNFEENMKKATQTFEVLAFKGYDANKALSKSFEQLNKVASEELSSLQKAFNALQIKGDFGIGLQKEKIAEAKRFYIQQFNEIKNSAETSAAETERAWAALKNAFSNINKANGIGSNSPSDFKVTMKAQEEAIALNAEFNDKRLRSEAKMYDEAQFMNAKFNAQKAIADQQALDKRLNALGEAFIKENNMLAEAYRINSEFNVKKAIADQQALDKKLNALGESFIKENNMLREAYSINAEFNARKAANDKEASIAKMNALGEAFVKENNMLAEAHRLNAEYNARKVLEAKATATAVAEANLYATRNQGAVSDIKQSSFDTLGIKSSLNIEAEKSKLKAAFEDIRASGIHSAKDIAAAHVAMQTQIDNIESSVNRVETGINGWSLASVAAIAKIQVLYSLINQIMSTIGQFPGQAIAAVEDYRSSVISNAAIITSMQTGVKDIGVAYQNNKKYAQGVQDTLIKMDVDTSANLKNLQDVNDKFQQQGVLIDVKNKKQREGFLDLANYLQVVNKSAPNKDMQFTQEIGSLQDFSSKAGNKLVQYLEARGVTEEIVEGWKEFGRVTDNNGYLFEKLGTYFVGFREAQKDINGLFDTAKSTLTTIYTEVLRGGFTPAVDSIITAFKSFNEWVEKHKEVLSDILNKGWLAVSGVVESLVKTAGILLGSINKIPSVLAGVFDATLPIDSQFKKFNEQMSSFSGMTGLVAKGWGLIGAVVLPEIVDKLSGALSLANAFVNMIYEGVAAIINSVGTLQTAIANVGKSTGQLLKGDAAGAGKTLAEAFSGTFRENLRNNVAGIKGAMISAGEDVAKLTSLSNYDKRYAEYSAKVAKGIDTGDYNPKGVGGKGKSDKTGNGGTSRRNSENSIDKAYTAYSNAFDEREATEIQVANRRIASINEQSYKDGLINLQDYLSKKAEMNQSSLTAELDAKDKELIEAYRREKEAFSKKLFIKDKKGASERDYATEEKNQLAALTLVEKAESAVAIAEGKLFDAKLKDASETINITRETIKGYKEQQAQYLDMTNDFVGAAKIRDQLSKDDLKYKQMLANAEAGNEGAIKAYWAEEAKQANASAVAVYKQTEQYNNLAIQLLELQGRFVEAAEARRKFEESNPAFKNLPTNVKEQKGQLSDLAARRAVTKEEFAETDISNAYMGSKNQFDSQVNGYVSMYRNIRDIEDTYGKESKQANAAIWGANVDMVRGSVSTISDILMKGNKDQFEAGKAFAIAMAVVDGAMAVIKAYNSMPGLPGIAVAALVAAQVGVQIATISSQQYQGRANGGPVVAGQTYVVNENRNSEGPEYFTPGVSGTITPASKMGGGVVIHQNFQVTGVGADIEANTRRIAKQAADSAKNEIYDSMNRGSAFSRAVGRA